MPVRVTRLALTLCALLTPGLPVAGQRLAHAARAADNPADVLSEAWGAAPAGRWYTHGGCAARSGASRTELPASTPSVAWSRELGKAIEGEPLAWDELLIVSARTGTGRRTLYALDRRSGEVLDEESFRTDAPLEPSLWADRVVVRAEPETLKLLQIAPPGKDGRRRFETLWTHELDGPVSAPLLLGHTIYATAAGSLLCLTPGARPPVAWSLDDDCHGRPSVRGDSVFTLRAKNDSSETWFEVVELDRHDGGERVAFVGPSIEGLRELLQRDLDWRLAVLDATVHVYTDVQLPLLLPGDERRKSQSFGVARLQDREFRDLIFAAALQERVEAAGRAGVELVLRADGEPALEWLEHLRDARGDLTPLTPETGPDWTDAGGDLARCRTALTLTDRHALVGPVALRFETGERFRAWRVWRAPVDPRVRLVPVRDGLLAVSDEATLSFLESPAAGLGTSVEPQEQRVELEGRAVLHDGHIADGALHLDRAAGSLELQGRRRVEARWPLNAVALLEDRQDQVVYAPDELALERAVSRLAEHESRERWDALLAEARSCKDADLLARLALEAGLAGADFDELERVLKERDRLLERPGRPNTATIAELDARRRDLGDLAVDRTWARLETLEPGPAQERLLRRVLAEQPDYPHARRHLSERLPDALQPGEARDLAPWLDLAQVLRRFGGRPVDDASVGETTAGDAAGGPTPDDLALLTAARSSWRDDLVGWRTTGLLVLAPRDPPRTLARAVATGALVDAALRKLLGGRACRRGDAAPLVLRVTGDADEFARLGQLGDWVPDRPLVRTVKAWKARLAYLPEDALAPTSSTVALVEHLARQWFELRCAGGSVRPERPGVWFAEGLEQALGELAFELGPGSWRPALARPLSVDVVAGANAEQLHPWAEVYAATTATLSALREDGEVRGPLPVGLRLGRTREVSAAEMFTYQAAATWHYLLTEAGGARGLELGGALDAAFDPAMPTPGVEALLELTPDQLGAEVQAWCRSVVDGLRL